MSAILSQLQYVNYDHFFHLQRGSSRMMKSANLPPLKDYSKPLHSPLYDKRRHEVTESAESLPYQDPDWPDKAECDIHVQRYPQWNEFPTTYLPPENKGFE